MFGWVEAAVVFADFVAGCGGGLVGAGFGGGEGGGGVFGVSVFVGGGVGGSECGRDGAVDAAGTEAAGGGWRDGDGAGEGELDGV